MRAARTSSTLCGDVQAHGRDAVFQFADGLAVEDRDLLLERRRRAVDRVEVLRVDRPALVDGLAEKYIFDQ